MADNNLVSVKVGNKVFSTDNAYEWTDVTADYPYVGGTLQTEFEYGESPIGDPIEEGGYFIYHDMIWKLCKFADTPDIYAAALYPTYEPPTPPGLPLYLDAYYNGATLYADDTWEHRLTEMPQSGDSFYFPDGNLVLISDVVIYDTVTAGSTATDVPPAVTVHEWQRYRNGSLLPFKPATVATADDGKLLSYDATSDSIKPTNKNVAEYDPSAVTEGDPLVFDDTGKIVSTDELTLANITVTDTATIAKSIVQETEQVTSTEDTIVLRENAVTPVPARGSGVIINNYDGNGTPLGILADSDGTVRVGAEGEISATFENGIFYFNSKVYQKGSGATIVGGSNDVHPTGSMLTGTLAPLSADYSKVVIMPNNDRLGLIINGDYYVTSVISGGGVVSLNITNGETVVSSYSQTSDTTFIDNIDNGTDIKDTIYGYSGPVTFGTATDLQPIATREEASVLHNNDLFAWSATDNQLKHITRPTINGTALKAVVTNGAVTGYDWGSSGGSGVSFIGTRTAYNTAKLIPEGQDGHIPAGSLVIITDEDELIIGEDA